MLDIRIGQAQTHENLTIIPLLAADIEEPPYLLLGEAIAAGLLRITEIGSGTVPRLFAENAADADVLVLDGEQLIGARQNRMTNRSLLLAARSETEIPVSCMEQGRWHFTGEEFSAAPQHSPSRVRRKARELEASLVAEGIAPDAGVLARAQSDVWDEIAHLSSKLRSSSPTRALDDSYRSVARDIEGFAAAFHVVENQVGLLGLANDRPIGTDVIGGRGLYTRLHDRLLRGYIMDALDARRTGTSGPAAAAAPSPVQDDDADTGTAAERFLDAVHSATRTPAPSVGRGTYTVLAGGRVIGGSLDDDAFEPVRVVHLSAFPANGGETHWREIDQVLYGPIARPSRRRRH